MNKVIKVRSKTNSYSGIKKEQLAQGPVFPVEIRFVEPTVVSSDIKKTKKKSKKAKSKKKIDTLKPRVSKDGQFRFHPNTGWVPNYK